MWASFNMYTLIEKVFTCEKFGGAPHAPNMKRAMQVYFLLIRLTYIPRTWYPDICSIIYYKLGTSL